MSDLAFDDGGAIAPNPSTPHRGGLAPWQLRRVLRMMGNLAGDHGLADLARECGISVGHFSRAFKQSAGMSPHQWLLERRVAQARHLLATSPSPIAEIAQQCGFADQSHLTRVFERITGTTPGRWRRQLPGVVPENEQPPVG
ncbi:AraC family transcriptional regulator [Niveispirillum sp. SYP-B3756]|uniref:helix-turn-helix domain-containing protein n=1 Tax=Niveispirillum sp. SYP-B3756 TaxID=2662178 RepID=UPI001B3B4D6E|nr:AraC family transcriptional regulator [Niveispirillum sp. SYP-B3756]